MSNQRISSYISAHRRFATLLIATMLVLAPAATLHSQTFSILHNFSGGADGANPIEGVTLQGSGNLYGGAALTVFRLRDQGPGWLLYPILEFSGTNGNLAGRLTVGPDGVFYGATYSGGIQDCEGFGCGQVFSLRPPATFCPNPFCAWTQTILYQFNPVNVPRDGYFPNGGIVFDSTGNLYGTTSMGGVSNQGTVYQLTRSGGGWTEDAIYDFGGGTDGGSPNAGMVVDQSGNLYGTTFGGGDPTCLFSEEACGVVFELSPTSSGWMETVLHTFRNFSDGAQPLGGLVADHNGNLYGTTSLGGNFGGGAIFELTHSGAGWTFNVLYDLNGLPGQVGPQGLLAIDTNGNVYGTTDSEGFAGVGNLFKLAPGGGGWTYTDLHEFAISASNGAYPHDGPTVDANGNLFGTTSSGGTGNCFDGCGVIYEVTP